MIQKVTEPAFYGDGKLKDDREKAEVLDFHLAFHLFHQEKDLQTEKGKAMWLRRNANLIWEKTQ